MKKRIVLAILLIVILSLSILPSAFGAEKMDASMIAQVNKPGVIFVYSKWTATMVWYDWYIDDSIYSDINAYIGQLQDTGQVDSSNFWPTYIYLFTANMVDYAYTTGDSNKSSGWIGGSGTGFIITPDGYLITNAHVVEMEEKELIQTFATANLRSAAQKHVNNFAQNWQSNYGYSMTQDELDSMYETVYYIYSLTMEVDNIATTHTAYIGNVQPGGDITTKGVQLDVRKVGTPDSSKDVAILKLDGNNFPTVSLGDDKELMTGDNIYVMGYPGVVTTSGVVEAPSAMQEPIMTQGILSAKQVWHDGGNILQYDAATFGGNSGGPVFNQYGEVVALHTFGVNDKGQRVAGYAFGVPVSTLKVYLSELNITPSESKFTADFKTAIDSYNSGDYATALELLRGINETNPGFPVVQELLAKARSAYDANPNSSSSTESSGDSDVTSSDNTTTQNPIVTSGNTSSGGGISTLTLILIGVGVVVVAVVVIIIIAASKKKKKPAEVQPAYVPQPQFQQVPVQPQFPQQQPQPQFPQQQPQPQFQQPVQPPVQPQLQQPAAIPVEAPVSTAGHTVCPGCGLPVAPDARFCDSCGFSLQTIEVIPSNQCPQCGAPLTPGAKFCNTCGFRME